MKLLLTLILLAFGSLLYSQEGTIYFSGGNVCEDQNWELVFADEFDGDELDRTKWLTFFPHKKTGKDSDVKSRTHADNEGQIYRDDNIEVSGGNLRLIVKDEPGEWMGTKKDYSAGMIWSKEKIDHYAKYEIRCKIPKGTGFFPAFWALAQGAETEIDVFEFGTQYPKKHIVGIINWETGKILHMDGTRYNGVDFSEDFHVFSVEYDKYQLRFFVDGEVVHSIDKFAKVRGGKNFNCEESAGYYKLHKPYPPPEQPLNIIANVAVGGPFTDDPNEYTPFPAEMLVDYIRVYKRAECDIPVAPTKITSNQVWSSDRMSGSITVADNTTLTIENAKVNIADGSSIILGEGARLVLKSSQLVLCSPESRWWGIITDADSHISLDADSSVADSYFGHVSLQLHLQGAINRLQGKW